MPGESLVVDSVSQCEPESRGPDVTLDDTGAGPRTALRTKVATGIRWGIIVSIATQVGRIVFLVALMRLLGPWNYGIVGQAAVVIAVAQIFVHFGLAVSIVQRPRLDQSEVGTAFWLNFAMGLLLAVLMVFGAPLLSTFFKTEELTAVLRVLSISLVLKGMTVVPTALLTRNMRFRSLATAELTSTFISGVLGVGAAAMGAGYWALVIQTVSLEAIYLFMILCISGLPDLSWSTTAARRLWSVSSRVMGADLVNYVSDQSDKFFVARFLGPTPLALYSLAFRVLQLTLGVLARAGQVVLPTFARLQDDRERLARAFLHVTESVSLAVCPAMTITILVAPIGVPAVFGEAWADAVVPLQLVAAMTIQYVLGGFMGPLTIAVGRADWEFRWSAVTMVVALVSFPVGLQWGTVGVAASYLIMLSVLNPIRFAIIQRLIPISARMYLRALAPAFACSVVLGVVWLLTEVLLQSATSGLVLATAASVTGAAAYVVALRVAWPDDFRRQLDLARLVVRGDRT
jgi:O-antigen/teichoic acid export membrane protein